MHPSAVSLVPPSRRVAGPCSRPIEGSPAALPDRGFLSDELSIELDIAPRHDLQDLHGQSPSLIPYSFHLGLRFSKNAPRPSRASSDARASAMVRTVMSITGRSTGRSATSEISRFERAWECGPPSR